MDTDDRPAGQPSVSIGVHRWSVFPDAPHRMTAPTWLLPDRTIAIDRPIVVGILNVTPDSFSDGGLHAGVAGALAHAERLLAEGADVLDVGGESTRPQGAVAVDVDEELRRVLPAIE